MKQPRTRLLLARAAEAAAKQIMSKLGVPLLRQLRDGQSYEAVLDEAGELIVRQGVWGAEGWASTEVGGVPLLADAGGGGVATCRQSVGVNVGVAAGGGGDGLQSSVSGG